MATKLRDFCGNEITCASEEAIKLYNTVGSVVEGFVMNIGSIAGPLKHAIELNSNFILARCLMVYSNSYDVFVHYNFRDCSFVIHSLLITLQVKHSV